jgi:hypothetical protein
MGTNDNPVQTILNNGYVNNQIREAIAVWAKAPVIPHGRPEDHFYPLTTSPSDLSSGLDYEIKTLQRHSDTRNTSTHDGLDPTIAVGLAKSIDATLHHNGGKLTPEQEKAAITLTAILGPNSARQLLKTLSSAPADVENEKYATSLAKLTEAIRRTVDAGIPHDPVPQVKYAVKDTSVVQSPGYDTDHNNRTDQETRSAVYRSSLLRN